MYSYTAYGLRIHSFLPLHDLSAAKTADATKTAEVTKAADATGAVPDVTVRLATVNRVPIEGAASGRGWWATTQEVCLYYEQLGAVLVRDGRELLIDPIPDVDKQALYGLTMGVALAVLLHQRGLLVLHASAVDLDGAALAFLGDAGLGKSTIAAALHARGCGVISDDVVALAMTAGASEQDRGGPVVLPAFPRLKLWPQVIASLGQDPEDLSRVYPGADKRVYHAVDGFPRMPVPLRCIYVLGAGTCLQIEPLRFQEAFIQLVRHSYAVHLLNATGTASRHFRQCAALAGCVPASRLKRVQSLASLSDLARLIEAHSAVQPSSPDLSCGILKS